MHWGIMTHDRHIMSYADTDRHSPYREEGEFHAVERKLPSCHELTQITAFILMAKEIIENCILYSIDLRERFLASRIN